MAEFIIADGCPHCTEAKSKGLCKTNICHNVASKKGNKIAREAKVDGVPSKVCKTKSGRYIKCKPTSTEKKKYGVS